MPLPIEDIDDAILLQRLATGDREAFNQIYLRYRTALYEAAFRRLGDQQAAEDLVQDLFFSLWNKRDSRSIENLPAYLHKAIRNRVFSFAARHKKIRLFRQPLQLVEKDSPDTQLITKELLATIYTYADTLPKKRRQIFLLYMTSRLSSAEIATELQVSVKTVQNQLGTAIESLYDLITSPTSQILIALLLTMAG